MASKIGSSQDLGRKTPSLVEGDEGYDSPGKTFPSLSSLAADQVSRTPVVSVKAYLQRTTPDYYFFLTTRMTKWSCKERVVKTAQDIFQALENQGVVLVIGSDAREEKISPVPPLNCLLPLKALSTKTTS